MKQEKNEGILVTGSHRSGSTWVGRMIALSPKVGYIHEPFNMKSSRPGKLNVDVNYWYQYALDGDELRFRQAFEKTLNFQYSPLEEIKVIRSWRDSIRMIRDFTQFKWHNFLNSKPLIKDPLALCSADWLFANFSIKPVVLIRHPAAFVSSLKNQGWGFDFSNFLHQPHLLEDKLSPFKSEIEEYVYRDFNIISQASLLWKIIHYVIYEYQQNHPNWFFVKYEDIATDPIKSFQEIYKYLNLDFTNNIKNQIWYYSNPSNSLNTPNPFFKRYQSKITRNSSANLNIWKERLTTEEIKQIKYSVKDISHLFYSENDW